jgi:hypothetical protein
LNNLYRYIRRRKLLYIGIKVSRKKMLLSAILLGCIIVVISFAAIYYNTSGNPEETQPQGSSPENAEGPLLVIPESPTGTLGLISALAAGFGMFTIVKKRR